MEEENNSSGGSSSRKNTRRSRRNAEAENMGRLEKANPGDLVWVRRRNGAWWPGIVLSPSQVPADGPRPPRSGNSVPIKLLGRLDGSIDWFNLKRSTRVKGFRCGEYDKCIEKAEARAARGPKMTWSLGKHVRREDAILHALEIENSYLPSDPLKDAIKGLRCKAPRNLSTESGTRCRLQKRSCHEFGFVEKKHLEDFSQNDRNISTSRYSSKRKKRTPSYLEDDGTEGMRRMRDLREIGSSKGVMQKSAITPCLTSIYQERGSFQRRSDVCMNLLTSPNEVSRSTQTHLAVKRRRSNTEHVNESLRKKDKRRSLSKLHEGTKVMTSLLSQWGASVQLSVQCYGADEPMNENPGTLMATDRISESSATSSADTSADASCSYQSVDVKENQVKEVSCMSGVVQNVFSNGFTIVDPLTKDVSLKGEMHDVHGPLNCTALQLNGVPCENGDVGPALLPHQSINNCDRSSYGQKNSEEKKDQSQSHKIEGSNENIQNSHDGFHESENDNLPSNSVSFAKTSDAMPAPLSLPDVTGIDATELNFIQDVEYDEPSETIDDCPDTKDITACDSSISKAPLLESPELPKCTNAVTSECRALEMTRSVPLDAVVHDVKIDEQPSYRGRSVPLVSLWSALNRRHFRGYPLEVQVLRSGLSKALSSRNDHRPVMSSLSQLLKRSETKVVSDQKTYKKKSSHKKRRKGSAIDRGDWSWRPHSKKPGASARKMRKLSSFAADLLRKEDKVLEKTTAPSVACIPVRLVYIRLNEALNFPTRPENTS